MGVSTYFEFITTLFGWVLYDRNWAVLYGCGLVFLPFSIVFISSFLRAKQCGEGEGIAQFQCLKSLEVQVYGMIFVLVFAAIPSQPVTLAKMEYVRPKLDCSIKDDINNGKTPASVNGTKTGTHYDQILATMNGTQAKVPLWWAVTHQYTKAIVSASIAGIPCAHDFAGMQIEMESQNFEDPRLMKEVVDFIHQCYMPARSQYMSDSTAKLTKAQIESTNYIGSSYFLTKPGYYDTFYSTSAKPDFAFDPVRDQGFEGSKPYGHPTCTQWWSTAKVGLRQKILDNLDPKWYDRLKQMMQVIMSTKAKNERDDRLIHKYITVKLSNLGSIYGANGGLASDYSKTVSETLTRGDASDALWNSSQLQTDVGSKLLALAGAALSAPSHMAAGVAARQGSAIFLCILLMGFYAMLPYLLLLSSYRLATLMTLTVVFFGMHFFFFLWALAFWIDNNLFRAIFTDLGPFTIAANPTQVMIIVWAQRFLYIILPALWAVALGWIGFNVQGLNSQMGTLTNAASNTFSSATSTLTSMATKGLKK